MTQAQQKKHQFLYQKANAEFDWNSTDWKNAVSKNNGHMASIKLANVGKYRYPTIHKLRTLLRKIFFLLYS